MTGMGDAQEIMDTLMQVLIANQENHWKPLFQPINFLKIIFGS